MYTVQYHNKKCSGAHFEALCIESHRPFRTECLSLKSKISSITQGVISRSILWAVIPCSCSQTWPPAEIQRCNIQWCTDDKILAKCLLENDPLILRKEFQNNPTILSFFRIRQSFESSFLIEHLKQHKVSWRYLNYGPVLYRHQNKMLSSKKIDLLRDFATVSHVGISDSALWSVVPLPSPCVNMYTVYTYTMCGGGVWGSGPQRDKHLQQSPLKGQFR